MSDDAELIRELRMRVHLLEMEVGKIQEEESRLNAVFGAHLTKQQLALLSAMIKRPLATFAYLDNTTEDHGKYNRHEGEMQQKIRTRVAMWKLRKKLKEFGVAIQIRSGFGYYLDDENKAKLKALMEKKDA